MVASITTRNTTTNTIPPDNSPCVAQPGLVRSAVAYCHLPAMNIYHLRRPFGRTRFYTGWSPVTFTLPGSRKSYCSAFLEPSLRPSNPTLVALLGIWACPGRDGNAALNAALASLFAIIFSFSSFVDCFVFRLTHWADNLPSAGAGLTTTLRGRGERLGKPVSCWGDASIKCEGSQRLAPRKREFSADAPIGHCCGPRDPGKRRYRLVGPTWTAACDANFRSNYLWV
jgi:hypothetical protein